MSEPGDVYTEDEVRRVARQVVDEVPASRVVEELIRRLRAIHATMPERRPEVTARHREEAAKRVKRWGMRGGG